MGHDGLFIYYFVLGRCRLSNVLYLCIAIGYGYRYRYMDEEVQLPTTVKY